jgi:hypothetical protein
MRENFDTAFELTIGLEGKPSNDPNDPGGFTIWGLASKFHPEINIATPLSYAKEVYLKQYWEPNGCDTAPFPMDICLFDSAVNPQNDPKLPYSGNQELLALGPENWQEYQLLRIARYQRRSKRIYVNGHINRVIKLTEAIWNIIKERRGVK